MKLGKTIQDFLREESGQSTTEYILILSVVVMIAMRFKTDFGNAIKGILSGVTSRAQSFTNEE